MRASILPKAIILTKAHSNDNTLNPEYSPLLSNPMGSDLSISLNS